MVLSVAVLAGIEVVNHLKIDQSHLHGFAHTKKALQVFIFLAFTLESVSINIQMNENFF